MASPLRSGKLASIPLERLFLWVAIPATLAFVFLNPPFGGVPDEFEHYLKALTVAQGELSPEASAPRDYVYLLEDLAPGWQERRWPRFEHTNTLKTLTTRPGQDEVEFTSVVRYAYPFAYLPQALALKVGMLCQAPPLLAFYLARLLAAAVALALIHAAIRTAPFGKLVFALVALLPETLQQIASLSYDALHIGGLSYFTAHVLALSQKDGLLSRGERVRTMGLSLVGTLLKPGYSLIALLVLVVPKRLFRSRAAHWSFVLGTLALGLLAVVLGWFVFHESSAVPSRASGARGQLEFVLENPFEFLGVVLRTLYKGLQNKWEGLVFLSGASMDSLSPFWYSFTAVAGVLLLRSHEEVVPLTTGQRLALLATALAQGLLVCSSLYVLNTSVGRPVIEGLQGRYLTVLLPPLILSFYKSGFRFQSDWVRRNSRLALLAFALCLIGCALRAIWRLYY